MTTQPKDRAIRYALISAGHAVEVHLVESLLSPTDPADRSAYRQALESLAKTFGVEVQAGGPVDPFDEALEALRTECEERDLEYWFYRKEKNAYWRPWVVCVYVGAEGREVARSDDLVMALTWAVATIRQGM